MSWVWAQGLQNGLQNYLCSEEHTDIIVKVGSEEFRMHKVVLCAQSKFFQKACRNFKEAESNVIELHHGEPEMLRIMIKWLRSGQYCDGTCRPISFDFCEKQDLDLLEPPGVAEAISSDHDIGEASDEHSDGDHTVQSDFASVHESVTSLDRWAYCYHPLAYDVEMYSLADFYDIECLRRFIVDSSFQDKISQLLPRTKWSNHASTKFAQTPWMQDTSLQRAVHEFCDVIQQIYTTIPEHEKELRGMILDSTVARFGQLCQFSEFQDLLSRLDQFNRELMPELGQALTDLDTLYVQAKRENKQRAPNGWGTVPVIGGGW